MPKKTTMAKTRQTARMTTGGLAPRKSLSKERRSSLSSREEEAFPFLRNLNVLQIIPNQQVVRYIAPRSHFPEIGHGFEDHVEVNYNMPDGWQADPSTIGTTCVENGQEFLQWKSVHPHVGWMAAKKISEFLHMGDTENEGVSSDESRENNLQWRFTKADVFITCSEDNPDHFANWLNSQGVQLLILPTDGDWMTHTKGNLSGIFDFLATLVKMPIRTYPPMSVAWWLYNKQTRDDALRSLKLPFCRLTVGRDNNGHPMSWNQIANQVIANHADILPEGPTDFIAKKIHGSGTLGVYHIRCTDDTTSPEQPEQWEESNGLPVPSGGTVLHIERFEAMFGKSEYRHFFKFDDSTRTSTKLIQETRIAIDGPVRDAIEVEVNTNLDQVLPVAQRESFKRDVVQAMTAPEPEDGAVNLSLLCLNYLWFRIDNVRVPENLVEPILPPNGRRFILNELDMFPLGYTFIDEYSPHRYMLNDLAQSIVDYIVLHWQNGWQY